MKQILFNFSEKKFFKNFLYIDQDLNFDNQKSFLSKNKVIKFSNDVDKYYEMIKPIIFKHFNSYHQIDLDQKKLEILIGFFLRRLIIILQEKWLTIEYFKKQKNKKYYFQKKIIKYPFSVGYDDNFFFKLFKDPYWNSLTYQQIINFRKIKNFYCINNKVQTKKISVPKVTTNIAENIKKKINRFTLYLLKNKKFYFYCTGLTKFNEVLLNFKYNGIPTFLFPLKNQFYSEKNYPKRQFNLPNKNNDQFINFFFKYYEKYSPSVYYEDITKFFFYGDYDLDNKSIYTSIGHYYDTDFKKNLVWSSNYKLNLIQHGADGFFLKIWTDLFRHDLKISDSYLAFTKNVSKIKKIINFKKNKKIQIDKNFENPSNIIIVMPPEKNFFTQLDITNIFRENIDQNLKMMINYMRKENIDFKIKFFEEQSNYNFQKRNKFKLSKKEISNKKIMNTKNSFFILTYFGTPVYELLNLNKPFVVLENQYFKYNYNSDFNNEINIMKKNKILIYNISEIFIHLEKIFPKINKWWNSKKILSARLKLIKTFSKGFKDKIVDIK